MFNFNLSTAVVTFLILINIFLVTPVFTTPKIYMQNFNTDIWSELLRRIKVIFDIRNSSLLENKQKNVKTSATTVERLKPKSFLYRAPLFFFICACFVVGSYCFAPTTCPEMQFSQRASESYQVGHLLRRTLEFAEIVFCVLKAWSICRYHKNHR